MLPAAVGIASDPHKEVEVRDERSDGIKGNDPFRIARDSGSRQRREKLVQRARDVLRQVEEQQVPPHIRTVVARFVVDAPEVLSLGPVPATFAMRILHGLCSPKPEVRAAFLQTVAEQSKPPPSPTINGMLQAGLLASSPARSIDITVKGRDLLARLEGDGALLAHES